MKASDKILARDDKLLKNEKSWRRSRIGVVILAVVWLFILYVVLKSSHVLEQEKEALFFAIGWFLFWIVLIDWINLRIWHIESIKYYRSIKEGK
jgi:hypothetical protein